MGIPAYFSHVIKEHRKIIKQISSDKYHKIDYLFLDSNSIIYDIIRSLHYSKDDPDFEKNAIREICKQIKYYIKLIKPRTKTFIAFDGVAPVAKLKQQQSRRYKNAYLSSKFPRKEPEWNTSAVTPGTEFMKKLSRDVKSFFSKSGSSVIVSTSESFGEGEHKIFQYIRDCHKVLKDKKILVYGLDADLIMLTLQHIRYCPHMYLFRETPHFIKSIDKSLDPNELYALDIPLFSQLIEAQMETVPKESSVSDYVFISFLLGNDFIPHMPALNIRTNGIERIFDAYRETVSNKSSLTKNGKICWSSLRKFVKFLSDNEHGYIKHEYELREKQEKRVLRVLGSKNEEEKWDVVPQTKRHTEKYINPKEEGWRWRYYKVLNDIDIQHSPVRNICLNYLEALEWTLHYYTHGCKNTRWSYHFMYPPLLKDLLGYIPSFSTELVGENCNPISSDVQLAFVLPESSSYLLKPEMRNKMQNHYKKNVDIKTEWAFCRYFWESHIRITPLPLCELEE